ncbi:MAG: tetratricopeptide repeat protein [Lachnoclostridium sp.]|nr:tetratricopeptide repeat protein [Lachnoclostridium sp.]
MRNLLPFIFLVLSLAASAKITQPGVVKEYNEKAEKTPLPGVELTIRHAGSTVSERDGSFSLDFLSLKPGERVNVRRIEKLGYEVFNKEAIEQWNLNPSTPFVIVMCSSDRFKKIRDNYERISSESYARQLKAEQAKLDRLKQEGKIKDAEYQQRLYELQENYERQLDNLDNYVDRFARIDLSELSDVEHGIIDLIQEGKIEEAIARYEEQRFLEKYFEEDDDIQEIDNAIGKLSDTKEAKIAARDSLLMAVNRQVDTYRMAGGTENFNKIIDIYQQLVSRGKLDANIVVPYLQELNTSNQYEKTIEFYNTLLADREYDPYAMQKILLRVANAHSQLQKLKEGLEIYKLCLAEIDKFPASDDAYTNFRRSAINNNIGLLYNRMGDLDNAEKFLSQCQYLVDEDNEHKFQELRRINNLGILYRGQRRYAEADSVFHHGIDVANTITCNNNVERTELTSCVSIINQGIGNNLAAQNKFAEARGYYQRSLDDMTKLYNYNPRRYTPDLATLNYNFARTYFLTEDSISQAIPYLENSMTHYESILKEHFIQYYFDNYAETFGNFARVYDNLGQKEEVIKLCARADSMLTTCSLFPYKGAKLQSAIGSTYADIKQYDRALEYQKKALVSIELMYSEYPDIYKENLAITYVNYAMTSCRIKDYNTAKEYYAKGIPIYEQIKNENPRFLKDYAKVVNTAFVFLATSPEYDEGLKYLRILQSLNPENIKLFEYECILLHGHGRIEEARAAFAKLLQAHPDYPTDSELYKNLSKS